MTDAVSRFPHFRPVAISDAEMFTTLFAAEQPVISEFTFTNLYVWRNKYGFEVSEYEGGVLVLARQEGEEPFFLPPVGCVDPAAAARRMLEHAPRICRVPKSQAGAMAAAGLTVEPDRDSFDYVYLASDLAELTGRKYHKKRNNIAQFTSRHRFEFRPISADLIAQCGALQNSWCDFRDCFTPENRSLAEENAAVLEALDNFEVLGLKGGAIIIEGKVEAFTLAEPLNRDTIVVHFEKANPQIIGLYQAVNREFCKTIAAEFRFVNREQDLGDPGLRQAKESYYPDHMIEKFTITR